MSSYDERNMAQIAMDELIIKFNRRKRDLEYNALKFTEDECVLKQLNLLLSDLERLKGIIDIVSKKGGLNGKKK